MKARSWLVAIVGTYIAACALPAFGKVDGEGTLGIVCLTAIPVVLLSPYWWANPLFFAGCVALGQGRDRLAAKLGVAALLLAVSFAFFCQFEGLRVGYLAWLASMLGLTTAGVAHRHDRGKPAVIDWSEVR